MGSEGARFGFYRFCVGGVVRMMYFVETKE